MQSSCFLLVFFPQMTVDKHSGGTLANMQGNLVSLMSQNHCIYFVVFYATEVYYVQLFQI